MMQLLICCATPGELKTVLTEVILQEEEGFVDMESQGIEVVADKFRLPRLFLKVPFDRIGEETKNFGREVAGKMLAEKINYKELIESILDLK